RLRRYWEPQTGTGSAIPANSESALEQLRELLFQAVECRLDREHPVATLLSGGLDSSAIAAIASRYLARKNRQLTAVAAVLPEENLGMFKDERSYIGEFKTTENLNIRYVTARGRGPFDSLADTSRFAAFPLRSSRFFLDEECAKAAIESGAQTLLSGAGGEFSVTSTGERYYLESAIRLRWFALFQMLRNRRASAGPSALRILAGQVFRTIKPLRGGSPMVFLNERFRRECIDGAAYRNRWPTQRRYQAAAIRFWLRKHALARGQTLELIRPGYPLLDKRILEFCLALPPGMETQQGYPRYLVRGALEGVLPPRIQWRTSKHPYSPDYFLRYNAQLGVARDYVAGIRPTDPVREIIDVSRLASSLQPVDPKLGTTLARDTIPLSLYVIAFLRQFSDFRS
ncbi:MAG: asparagine synthase-related protein, partial [Acidobacteriota bacterium]|nr:asparagine synthase-related protein [Acidobacteriota bacterium]